MRYLPRYVLIVWLALLMPSGGTMAANPLKIILFGDSLVTGPYIPDEEKLHTQLQKQLKHYGVDALIINAGVNGETSAGGIARITPILALKPDMVVLALGANDMLRSLDPVKTHDNLNVIIHRLLTEKTRVLLAGMKAKPGMPQDYQDKFNAVYPELAKRYSPYGMDYFPFLLQDVALVAAMNLQDGLHPNAKGAAKIAENMTPYVLRALGYSKK
jgi:acyl-CoA thioesterase I